MLLVGSFAASVIFSYVFYLYKWLKKYRIYRKSVNRFLKAPTLNINEVYDIFQNEPVGKKKYIIAKGIK